MSTSSMDALDLDTEASSDKVMGVHPTIGRGIFVFAAGMALAAVSFVVEQAVIKAAQDRN